MRAIRLSKDEIVLFFLQQPHLKAIVQDHVKDTLLMKILAKKNMQYFNILMSRNHQLGINLPNKVSITLP